MIRYISLSPAGTLLARIATGKALLAIIPLTSRKLSYRDKTYLGKSRNRFSISRISKALIFPVICYPVQFQAIFLPVYRCGISISATTISPVHFLEAQFRSSKSWISPTTCSRDESRRKSDYFRASNFLIWVETFWSEKFQSPYQI